MGLLSFDAPYDRPRILQAAARAQARRRRRRAIKLYRRVLALEASNADLLARVAPLLAETRQRFDAWLSFRKAARAYLKEGRPETALATYREAARCLPRELDVWLSIARLHRQEGRPHEAIDALLEGVRYFRGRRFRPQAVCLLSSVREIEPWHLNASLQLARRLARVGRRAEAGALLDDLAEHVHNTRQLERVRYTQWRIHPSLRNSWRWLRSRLRRERRTLGPEGLALPRSLRH